MGQRMPNLILLTALAFSFYAMCLIWYTQLITYPLYALVAPADFPRFYAAYNVYLLLPLAPTLLVLLASAALIFVRPAGVPAWTVWAGLALELFFWGWTAVAVAPLHGRLTDGGYNAQVIRDLVSMNWPRTAAWTAHGLLLLWSAWTALD